MQGVRRELEEALAAGRGVEGLRGEVVALKQEVKMMKDERRVTGI